MRLQANLNLLSSLVARTVVLIAVVATSADATEKGIWVKSSLPAAQVNVACTQVWECSIGQDIVHSDDTYVWRTPNKLTVGVCSAAGGPPDSCNECLASPPSESCEWELRNNGT